MVKTFSFFLKALIWGGILFLFAGKFAVNGFWMVVLSVFLFSVPIGICGIYGNTIHQIRRLTLFTEQGWIYRLLSGRPLKIALWASWALGTSFFMLVQFHAYGNLEWYVFFLVVPVFWCVYAISRRQIARELKPYLVTSMALTWARRVTPFLMLIIYLVMLVGFGTPPEYLSLQEAIDARKIAVGGMTGSALVWEVSQYSAFYEGVKAYALGRLGSHDALWALAFLIIGGWVVFYNACAMLSCLLIPGAEYRRIFGPLTDADIPPVLSTSRIAVIAAVFTFLSLFIYLPVFVTVEAWVRQTPKMAESRQRMESWAIPRLEQIDDAFFKEGTFALLQDARFDALRNVEVSLVRLDGQIDRAFDRLEINVDVYLDWYYSLVGEYARIANLLVGEIEDSMVAKLEESLRQGDAFGEVEVALNSALAEYEKAQEAYQQAAEKIMKENRVNPAGFPIEVVQRMSLADVLDPPVHKDAIGLHSRLAAGTGGGAIAGAVTAVAIKKVVGKAVGKNMFKLAAKALTKVVVGKTAGSAAGAGAGAAGGAAIGSFLPVVGTTAGAVIGGIIGGVLVGVSVDKMLIELEELINREAFRREIVSAVREARVEFKAKMPERKPSFSPISAFGSKFNPQNTSSIPAVKCFAGLDLDEKSWFSFGH